MHVGRSLYIFMKVNIKNDTLSNFCLRYRAIIPHQTCEPIMYVVCLFWLLKPVPTMLNKVPRSTSHVMGRGGGVKFKLAQKLWYFLVFDNISIFNNFKIFLRRNLDQTCETVRKVDFYDFYAWRIELSKI